jgi:outer membrane protein assembly factor BamA
MTTIPTSQQINKAIVCVAVSVGLLICAGAARGQEKLDNGATDPSWSQTSQERDRRLELASGGQYRVGHIYVSGNKYTRDREVRERLVRGFTQGDIFERAALDKSLRRVSIIKRIYPVTIENIAVRLDEKERQADFVINVKEKKD